MTPGAYLRSPTGWLRVVRIDPERGPICERRAPLDDAGIPNAGRCTPWEFVLQAAGRRK